MSSTTVDPTPDLAGLFGVRVPGLTGNGPGGRKKATENQEDRSASEHGENTCGRLAAPAFLSYPLESGLLRGMPEGPKRISVGVRA